jgi:hypothetical protein
MPPLYRKLKTYKAYKPSRGMRIKFVESSIRKAFFFDVKKSINLSWKIIYQSNQITRQTFDRYKSGELSMPQNLFKELLNHIKLEKRKFYIGNTITIEDNWGKILGGKKAYKLNFDLFNIGRKKGLQTLRNKEYIKRKEISYKMDIVITEEICEFIGAFIGDGCFNVYNKKIYQTEFSGDSRYDLNYHEKILIPIIKKVILELKPHLYFPKNKNALRTVFYSKKLFLFLRDGFGFIPGKKTETVTIPEVILNSKDSFIKRTIRGIFDTDGGIFLDKREHYKKPYQRIFLETKSSSLYTQLVSILSKDFKLYHKFNKPRKIYKIEIYGLDQLNKWMKLIGFSNERHLEKIARVA